jgi:methyl-accepting chemotaxis protein
VQRATAEQRAAALTIRETVSEIRAMAQSIQRNTESHSAASEAVSEAVNRILEIAQQKPELANG